MTAFEMKTAESCCSLRIVPADLFRPVTFIVVPIADIDRLFDYLAALASSIGGIVSGRYIMPPT